MSISGVSAAGGSGGGSIAGRSSGGGASDSVSSTGLPSAIRRASARAPATSMSKASPMVVEDATVVRSFLPSRSEWGALDLEKSEGAPF
jgi:hypothetical protein